jgi:hypothetical protein
MASRLKGAIYYLNNLPAISRIIESFDVCGILTQNAKEAVAREGLIGELIEVNESYGCLADIVKKLKIQI